MKFKKNTMYLLLSTLLLSTSTYAQLICSIENRNHLIKDQEEFSGLAYHPKEEIFLIPIDDPIPPVDDPNGPRSIQIRGYNLKENKVFDVRFLDDKQLLTGDDFEGLTYLKDDFFALLEEDENKIYFLKYIPDSEKFEVLVSYDTEIPVPGDFSLEGISYDPNTERLYVIMEGDWNLYSIPISLANSDLTDVIAGDVKFENSKVDLSGLTNLRRATGLYHLGQNYPANHPLANNILVTSWDGREEKVVEIKLSLDENNNLSGQAELKKEVDFNDIPTDDDRFEPKPGGVVAIADKIYVVSEIFNDDGGLSSYEVKSQYDSCSGNVLIFNENCDCVFEDCEPNELVHATETNPSNDLLVLYESSQLIETETTASVVPDVIIRENEAVDLNSNHITLNEGFKVETGGCLNAEIKPCE